MVTNGGSTGFAPIHVSRLTKAINTQNVVFFFGENLLFNLFVFIVSTIRIKIAPTIASTPPNFDGIDRKIA
jgi:hypothetical protein